ncbi:MAG: RDD family protein [Verrucomicrobiota bacterium]
MSDGPGFYEAIAPPELGSQAMENPNEGFAEHINEVVVLDPDNSPVVAKKPRIPVAGRMRRGMAKGFDGIIVIAIYGAVMFWWASTVPENDQPMFVALAFTVGLVVSWGVWFIYNFLTLWILGTTLGKALLGMRVRRVDGGRLGFLGAIARTIAESFSFLLLGFGYILAVLDPERKRAMHDHFCGTIVVMRQRKR